jgi:membrane-bound metal-dependent hydrolase YbcI (DUF457 family)
MTWRTHLAGGITALWLLAPMFQTLGDNGNLLVDTSNPLLLAIVAGFGALLPDLDAKESRIKHLRIGGIEPFYLPAIALNKALGHRGFLHSALGLLTASLLIGMPLALWQGIPFLLTFTLGYASHLALDAATKAGIPLWFPKKKRIHLLPTRLRFLTGSQEEDALFLVLLLLIATFFLTIIPTSYSF